MATPAAAAPASDDVQGPQDNTTHHQATARVSLHASLLGCCYFFYHQATATAALTQRRAGPKAASKPLADYSLLAPPHMRQIKVDWVKKDKVHIDALKACRLQVEDCSWYQQAYN
jgi:hypothetical protein